MISLGYQVAVLAGLGIISMRVSLLLQDLAYHDRSVVAGIDGDLAGRPGDRFLDDLDAVPLVVVFRLQSAERLGRAQQRDAAARQDALLDRGAGRVERVIDAVLALLHLDLRLAAAADDRGVLLVDHHPFGAPEHVERDVLELDAEVLGDRGTAGQDRDVLQHGLAAIAEPGRLDGRDLEAAAQLVDHEGGERLALDVLGNDDERLAGLHDRLEQRQELLQPGQFLFIDQEIRILHLDAHLVGIGDEIRRDVAAVELHALDHFELGLERFGLLDGDHALVADLLHGVRQKLPYLRIAVGRDGADLGDLLVRGDVLGVLVQVRHDGGDCQVDAALEVHRVHARGNGFGALPDDGVGEHGRGRGAVAGLLRCPGGDLAYHLGAHVLELVLELDVLGDGDAVLGDPRRTERFVEHDIAAFGAQRHSHRVGEYVDTAQHLVASIDRESDFFGSHLRALHLNSSPSRSRGGNGRASNLALPSCFRARHRPIPRDDGSGSGGLPAGHRFDEHSHDVAFLHDQVLDAVDLDFGARPLAEQHAVAGPDVDRDELSGLVAAAGTDRDDLALLRLFLGLIRDDDAAGRLRVGVDSANDHAVVKGAKFHLGGTPIADEIVRRRVEAKHRSPVLARMQLKGEGYRACRWHQCCPLRERRVRKIPAL